VLTVDNLSAGYGKLQILTDVSIEAKPGEVTVIVGPNGSGKSTLLRAISGLCAIYKGTVKVDSTTLSGMQSHQIARMGVAYLPQTENVFTNLSVQENFRLAGFTVKNTELEAKVKELYGTFPRLVGYMKTKAANLSGGERQMLAMGMALIRKPSVLMFDEPTASLAPKLATQVLEMVTLMAKERGLTVLLVEQNARRALEVGDRAYLLVSGQKAFEGTAKDLLAHPELSKLYLGLKAA
jgi:branched-chain amino acid transport system ATP-binding protein